MNRTIINLKPCPFCGRTPTVEDCGSNEYFIKCKCGIVQDKLYTQRCDAANHWNNRKVVEDIYDLVREQRDIAARSFGLIYAANGENFDDVKKVVWCKDCIHNPDRSDDDICPFVDSDGHVKAFPNDDFFCKWGERRDDAEIH